LLVLKDNAYLESFRIGLLELRVTDYSADFVRRFEGSGAAITVCEGDVDVGTTVATIGLPASSRGAR
jgi:hypothetical protein